MTILKLKFPQEAVLKRKVLITVLLLIGLLLIGTGIVSYKYFALRKDYGRVVNLLYEDDETESSVPDNTVNGRHSADKYVDDVYQDPGLVEITKSLGIHKNNIQGLEMRMVDKASTSVLADGTVPTIDPDGVFMPGYYEDNKWGDVARAPKIEIEKHLKDEELKRIVAHEFLHHMYSSWWNKETARRYDQDLILFYVNNYTMRNRLLDYQGNNSLKLTEIYAYGCTEYSDDALGSKLAQICGQWFDRSKLTYIY